MNISKNNLILKLEEFLINSNFAILNIDSLHYKRFIKLEVLNNDKIIIFASLSNIGNSYLPNRSDVKRRQVGHVDINALPKNSYKQIVILIGFYTNGKKDILAVWNPFYFSHHKSNRSCYILDETILKATDFGYFKSNDCGTPVYACDKSNFGTLIKDYIKDNGVL